MLRIYLNLRETCNILPAGTGKSDVVALPVLRDIFTYAVEIPLFSITAESYSLPRSVCVLVLETEMLPFVKVMAVSGHSSWKILPSC